MKLEIFDHSKGRYGSRVQHRAVSVNRRNAKISFSRQATEELGLSTEYAATFAKDSDSKNDWYITFVESENETGTKLRIGQGRKTSKIYSMRTQNRAASGAILDSVKATYSATFIIAATPTEMPDGTIWYRVLTANPIRTK